jgi:hypothetical protein
MQNFEKAFRTFEIHGATQKRKRLRTKGQGYSSSTRMETCWMRCALTTVNNFADSFCNKIWMEIEKRIEYMLCRHDTLSRHANSMLQLGWQWLFVEFGWFVVEFRFVWFVVESCRLKKKTSSN